jgi:hypothetical protein
VEEGEEEVAAAAVPPAGVGLGLADPWMVALRTPGVAWADVMDAEEAGLPPPGPSDRPLVKDWTAIRAARAEAEAAKREAEEERVWQARWAARSTWEELEAQPFWVGVESIMCEEAHSVAGMSNRNYEALMRWLYAKGWDVQPSVDEDGTDYTILFLEEAVYEPEEWVPPPRGVPIPRFCRDLGCKDRKCRYEHGDTIHRLNEPCKFGAGCGSGDPAKRAQCLRMHPGEVWNADMVIHRH